MLRLLSLLLLALALPAFAGEAEVMDLGRELGLRDVAGFVATVRALRTEGRLPRHYLTKDEAGDLGWRPGSDLCQVAEGRTIGGDRFGNRERLLPERRGRRWQEADLDFRCGRRGAKRLVWSNDGLIYVTVDHYDSFEKVPE